MGLLILEREVGEWVHVGDDINILLHDVRGKKAWLGFDAPREIEIVRDDAAIAERRPRFIMSDRLKVTGWCSKGVASPDELFVTLSELTMHI